jgi:hypothetical protein
MEDRAASTIFIKHHVAACMEDLLHDINQVKLVARILSTQYATIPDSKTVVKKKKNWQSNNSSQ